MTRPDNRARIHTTKPELVSTNFFSGPLFTDIVRLFFSSSVVRCPICVVQMAFAPNL